MKTILLALMVCLGFSIEPTEGAQMADGRMYCLSLRFGRGAGPFNLYSLDLTGINASINGELFPVSGSPPSHFSYLILTDEADEEIPGTMALHVPTTDNNGNGFEDIYESSVAFSGTSSGSYSFPGQTGNLAATWSRSAGSSAGVCQLNFQGLGTFTHTFNILEYKGPLTYTPGSNNVTGNVAFALMGDPDIQLQGPIAFTKSALDPYNQLAFTNGIWTNQNQELFPFLDQPFFRDQVLQTNYFSYFEFDDWNLSTSEPDYYSWILSVDDRNDTDTDGIPDFSDAPQNVSVNRPVLALYRGQTNVLLNITGTVGQVCEIQEATVINQTNWPTIASITLTNNSQTVSLPLPSTQTKFWRVRVP